MRMKVVMKTGWLALMMACASTAETRPYFNDLKKPDSMDDLLAIQKTLQSHLEHARAATVCIQIGEGSGSGVIVSEDGLILTAAHVSTGVDKELTVVMEDGTELKARSLGVMADTDAAMVQILDEGRYPYVEVDQSDSTRLGDWVFSLGHSGGFDKARGSVLRIGRMVRIADYTVQSDCQLIGGDSGGPLFDMNGKLIGIHSRVGINLEVNMHVPMHVYQSKWEELKKGEFLGEGPFVQRPAEPKPGSGYIGIEVAEDGLIIDVDTETAAYAAGVRKGDHLMAVDDVEVTTKQQLVDVMKTKTPGEKVKLSLRRGDKTKHFNFLLDQR